MSMKTIHLGGVAYQVSAVPLGRLKVLIPALTAFSRAVSGMSSAAQMSEEDMDQALVAVAAGLGKTPGEVAEMPASLPDLISAIEVFAEVSGLTARPGDVGETSPGAGPATTSIPSTDSSPTS